MAAISNNKNSKSSIKPCAEQPKLPYLGSLRREVWKKIVPTFLEVQIQRVHVAWMMGSEGLLPASSGLSRRRPPVKTSRTSRDCLVGGMPSLTLPEVSFFFLKCAPGPEERV